MIRRRPKRKLIVSITPVLDVVFLLIIFFILTSHMKDSKTKNTNPAASPDIETLDKASAVSVSVDGEGVVWLQGQQTSVGQLESLVGALLGDREDRRVKVSIDKDLNETIYLPVIKAISKAGGSPDLVGKLSQDEESP